MLGIMLFYPVKKSRILNLLRIPSGGTGLWKAVVLIAFIGYYGFIIFDVRKKRGSSTLSVFGAAHWIFLR
jgi:hypothetical protein